MTIVTPPTVFSRAGFLFVKDCGTVFRVVRLAARGVAHGIWRIETVPLRADRASLNRLNYFRLKRLAVDAQLSVAGGRCVEVSVVPFEVVRGRLFVFRGTPTAKE